MKKAGSSNGGTEEKPRGNIHWIKLVRIWIEDRTASYLAI